MSNALKVIESSYSDIELDKISNEY